MPTHLFGMPADLSRLRRLRGSGPAFIVEDAAQALGVQSSTGQRLGGGGDAAVFSLGRGKHLSAGGGGFIATDDLEIALSVAALVAALPEPTVLGSLGHVAEMAAVEALIDPCWYWLPAGLPFLGLGETVYSTDFEVSRIDHAAVGALQGWQMRLERANRDRQRTCRAYLRELAIEIPSGQDQPLLRFPIVLECCRTPRRPAGGSGTNADSARAGCIRPRFTTSPSCTLNSSARAIPAPRRSPRG